MNKGKYQLHNAEAANHTTVYTFSITEQYSITEQLYTIVGLQYAYYELYYNTGKIISQNSYCMFDYIGVVDYKI